jgi:hypothetical protein
MPRAGPIGGTVREANDRQRGQAQRRSQQQICIVFQAVA